MKRAMGILCGACIVGLIAVGPLFPIFAILHEAFGWPPAWLRDIVGVASLFMCMIGLWLGLVAWALENWRHG